MISPPPGFQISNNQGRISALWQSWFYQLYNFVTGALTPASLAAATTVSAGTSIQTGAVLVSDLPMTPALGARYMVTDATSTTFNSIVAGGGANTVPVFGDGTNWRIG